MWITFSFILFIVVRKSCILNCVKEGWELCSFIEKKEIISVSEIPEHIISLVTVIYLRESPNKCYQHLFFFKPYNVCVGGKNLILALPISFSLLRFHNLPWTI